MRKRLALLTPMEKMPSLAVTDAAMAAWVLGLVGFIQMKVATEEMEAHQAGEVAQEGQVVVEVVMGAQVPEAKSESLVGR